MFLSAAPQLQFQMNEHAESFWECGKVSLCVSEALLCSGLELVMKPGPLRRTTYKVEDFMHVEITHFDFNAEQFICQETQALNADNFYYSVSIAHLAHKMGKTSRIMKFEPMITYAEA